MADMDDQDNKAADLVDRARNAVSGRVDRMRGGSDDETPELPGMSLMEHLEELRKRVIRCAGYLAVGMVIAYYFHEKLVGFIQKPLTDMGLAMTMTHPTDALNFYIQASVVFGGIFASPFILYQVWLFISPGMYANEKRYVFPFMTATVGLFLSGAWFGYRYVMPGAMKILIGGFGKNFAHMITIEDYTGFFLSVILGLGICFELPILMFFLSIFGIVDYKFLLRHIKYAILIIFVVAAVICPSPEVTAMCLFALPMLILYMVGVGVAFFVHPARRKKKKEQSA